MGEPWSEESSYLGTMKNLSIWNEALTVEQIQSFLDSGLEMTSSTIGLWNFNEGSGDALTDLSENGINGTIYGVSWFEDPPEPQDGDNHSLSFDGVDDYIAFDNSVIPSSGDVTTRFGGM